MQFLIQEGLLVKRMLVLPVKSLYLKMQILKEMESMYIFKDYLN